MHIILIFILCLVSIQLITCKLPPKRLRTIQRERSIEIARGQLATTGQFPFQVGFVCERNGNPMFHFCGGSILSSNKILTAGHCCQDFPGLSNVRVVAGRTQIVPDAAHANEGSVFTIASYDQHENYNDASLSNDLCIVTVSENMTFSSSLSSIVIPGVEDEVSPGDEVSISGWGFTHTAVHPNDLYYDSVPIRNASHCLLNSHESLSSLCAATDDGHDSCRGDSGGPLFASRLVDNQKSSVLYGVVSWGVGSCGAYGSYGVYVRLTNYRSWIVSKVPSVRLSNSKKSPSDVFILTWRSILCSLSSALFSTSILCF